MARCRGVVVVSGAWAISSKQWSRQYNMGAVAGGTRRGGSDSLMVLPPPPLKQVFTAVPKMKVETATVPRVALLIRMILQ
jgi:hypothetical protein